MKEPPPPPVDWPRQADEDYDRIRVLGRGAFGEVWLARSKTPDENGNRVEVAIKGVRVSNEQEDATAEREIAILNEMNHPNIIRLIHAYEPASADAKGRYMALSYVNGPDLGQLLEARGALGLPLAQLIAQDLISAVAYCHARGVIHRDIKPDNILLEGCKEGKEQWANDDIMWDDCKLPQGRFKAVLADFGLARATSAKDYEQIEEESKRALYDRKKSRIMLKGKSAVGTKHFSAPEIVGNIRKKRDSEVALAPCVSSYALISDAYAVGATLSEITTGVPPGEDVEMYVDLNRKRHSLTKMHKSMPRIQIGSPLTALRTRIKRRFSFGQNHTQSTSHPPPSDQLQPHEIQLRHMYELPEPAADLIVWLMMEDASQRLSVREAQNHPWIGGYENLPHGDVPSQPEDPMIYVEDSSAHI